MTAALTPALALDYLRELSADFRAGVVLDARGGIAAGDEKLLAHARELLATRAPAESALGAPADSALGAPSESGPAEDAAGPGKAGATDMFAGSTPEGRVFAARDEDHAIVVVTGPFALSELALHDLRTALSALGRETGSVRVPVPVPDRVVRALIEASGEVFRRQRAI